MNKKGIIIGIVVVLLIILVLGLANISEQKSDKVIRVGVLTPLSGPIAIAGEVQKNALNMAIEDGKNSNIELIYEDSKYDPKTSVSGYQSLKQKGIDIIIADGSPVVASIREQAVNDGILIFAQSATTPSFTDESNLTCRIGLTADMLAPSMVEYVKNNLGYENIAIMVANNEYGITMAEEMEKAINSLGGRIVIKEVYDQSSGDLRTNILKIIENESQIDALLVTNNITPESMFNQLKELGWNKPVVSDAWTLTSPNMTNRQVAAGVPFIDYAYTPQAELNSKKEAVEYAKKYEEKYGGLPILLGALTYDSYNILSKAIDEVGSDPQDLADYLVKMPTFEGITGDINFDDSCQNINKKLVWRTVLPDGSFENLD